MAHHSWSSTYSSRQQRGARFTLAERHVVPYSKHWETYQVSAKYVEIDCIGVHDALSARGVLRCQHLREFLDGCHNVVTIGLQENSKY